MPTSLIHFLTKTLPPSEKTFLKFSEARLPLDLGNIFFSSYPLQIGGEVKPQKMTAKASSLVPRSKHIREKVFRCHTLGCLAKAGEVEGVLWVSPSKVPPDPVDQLVNLSVREPAVEQKKVKPPAELQNSSLVVDITVLQEEGRLERLKPKEQSQV